jgi:regulator of protease activity HflC (stomatin/prohibitin superfamily)
MTVNSLFQLLLKILGAIGHLSYEYAREHPALVVAAAYGLARAMGIMIQSGQRGVLFRWGRAVKELEPGFHWLIPVVHGVKTTPVRSITIDLPDQKVMTADGLVYDVGVNLVYRVEDATKALTLVDHIDSGCRAAIPIIITEVLRVRDQAELLDRVALDRELSEHMHAWIARWGLVVEQAGFTTIAPNKSVLHTTQLRSKTIERARALRTLLGAGLEAEAALVLIGTERQPVAKSSRRYHRRSRQPGRATGARGPGHGRNKKTPAPLVAAKSAEATKPAGPTTKTTGTPTRTVGRPRSQ